MNIFKAQSLESPRAVLNRFVFRLLWCFVGAAAVFAVLTNIRNQIWFVISAVMAISLLGAIVDSYQLNHPKVSVQRLRVLGAAVIFLGLMAYFFIRSSGMR